MRFRFRPFLLSKGLSSEAPGWVFLEVGGANKPSKYVPSKKVRTGGVLGG